MTLLSAKVPLDQTPHLPTLLSPCQDPGFPGLDVPGHPCLERECLSGRPLIDLSPGSAIWQLRCGLEVGVLDSWLPQWVWCGVSSPSMGDLGITDTKSAQVEEKGCIVHMCAFSHTNNTR